MFIDEAKIYIKAGNGGNGCVSFRREKYIPNGGPDGGDGGNGGSLRIRASRHVNDLSLFNRQRKFEAENGRDGLGKNMKGSSGDDLTLDLPLGTQIFDQDHRIMVDLKKDGDEHLLVKGGNGGWGNQHFASSIKQAPKWAKDGLPGEDANLMLELKVIADIGLIGLPNAGKSTLLSVMTNAKPKIADYEFTTLEPNLGVLKTEEVNIVVADIPGLIEGAAEGRGLGHKFLKHIERTRAIVHVLSANSEDIVADYRIVRKELEKFSKSLTKKDELVVVNKSDIIDAKAREQIEKALKKNKIKVLFISAVTHQGVKALLDQITLEAKK